ncbi:VanZ family protein [Bacillus cereus group sp. BceL062]|uniref:VanZ family protein n=1 Tax=Bacillus cereus group TaxID=86661 RepID=UPI00321AD467
MIGITLDLHIPTILFFIILGCVILYINDRKKNNKFPFIISLYRYSFVIYAIFLIKYVFFPIHILFNSTIESTIDMYYQLIPFKSISKEIFVTNNWIQIIGNVLLLFPLGVYLGLLNKKAINLKYVLKMIILTTITIEIIQFIIDLLTGFPNRLFDVDDIILNVFGGLIGWILLKVFAPIFEKNNIPTIFNQQIEYK